MSEKETKMLEVEFINEIKDLTLYAQQLVNKKSKHLENDFFIQQLESKENTLNLLIDEIEKIVDLIDEISVYPTFPDFIKLVLKNTNSSILFQIISDLFDKLNSNPNFSFDKNTFLSKHQSSINIFNFKNDLDIGYEILKSKINVCTQEIKEFAKSVNVLKIPYSYYTAKILELNSLSENTINELTKAVVLEQKEVGKNFKFLSFQTEDRNDKMVIEKINNVLSKDLFNAYSNLINEFEKLNATNESKVTKLFNTFKSQLEFLLEDIVSFYNQINEIEKILIDIWNIENHRYPDTSIESFKSIVSTNYPYYMVTDDYLSYIYNKIDK